MAEFASWLYVLECADGAFYVGRTSDLSQRFRQHWCGAGSAWTLAHPPVAAIAVRPLTSPLDEDTEVKRLMLTHGIDLVRGGSYSSVALSAPTTAALQRELWHAKDLCILCGGADHWANNCRLGAPSEPVPRETPVPGPEPALGLLVRETPAPGPEPALGPLARVTSWLGIDFSPGPVSREMPVPGPEPFRAEPPDRRKPAMLCLRCGRSSHEAAECRATSDLLGGPPRGANRDHPPPAAPAALPRSGPGRPSADSPRCARCGRRGHSRGTCYAKTSVDGRALESRAAEP